jgi:hypothetical protein
LARFFIPPGCYFIISKNLLIPAFLFTPAVIPSFGTSKITLQKFPAKNFMKFFLPANNYQPQDYAIN